MDSFIRKIILPAIALTGFSLFTNSAMATVAPLHVDFERTPLFGEADIAPGSSVTGWIKVANNSGQSQSVIIDARNFAEPVPTDDLARVLEITIKKGGTVLYGPKLLSDFYSESGDPNPTAEDDTNINLLELTAGAMAQYDIAISFPLTADNYWQNNTTGFDIAVGFKRQEGTSGFQTLLMLSGDTSEDDLDNALILWPPPTITSTISESGAETSENLGLLSLLSSTETPAPSLEDGTTPTPTPTPEEDNGSLMANIGSFFSFGTGSNWFWLLWILLLVGFAYWLSTRRDN